MTFLHTLSSVLRLLSRLLAVLAFIWIVIWAWDGWGTLPYSLDSRIPNDAFEPTAALLSALGALATWWFSHQARERANHHNIVERD
jgi:hypothetical protein